MAERAPINVSTLYFYFFFGAQTNAPTMRKHTLERRGREMNRGDGFKKFQ